MQQQETQAKTLKEVKVIRRQKATHARSPEAVRPPFLVSLSYPMQNQLLRRVNRQEKRAKSSLVRLTSWNFSSLRNFRTLKSAAALKWLKSRQRTWQPKCSRRWMKELPVVAV